MRGRGEPSLDGDALRLGGLLQRDAHAQHTIAVARLHLGGVGLVGQGERSNAPAVSILAQNLFAAGAARLVIGAQMPKDRAAMHLDTVFTFCNRNVVTIYEPVVSQIIPIRFTPDGNGGVRGELSDRPFLDEVKDALGISDLNVVTTGGDEFEAERNQWDDGNNVVALSPGVIVSYLYSFVTGFSKLTLDASLVIAVTFFGTAIAATILPWWKKDLYEKSPIVRYQRWVDRLPAKSMK